MHFGTLVFSNLHLLDHREDLRDVRDRVGFFWDSLDKNNFHPKFQFRVKFPEYCKWYLKKSVGGLFAEGDEYYQMGCLRYDLKEEIRPHIQEEYAKLVAKYNEKVDALREKGTNIGERIYAQEKVSYHF